MFGYIRVSKPELRFKEYDYYKAVYCTLCRTMGKRYGRLTRLGLSYDFTFLALLELALDDTAAMPVKGKCVCNRCKSCFYVPRESAFELAAAVSVLLMGCKIKDDQQDETGWRRLKAVLTGLFLKGPCRKARLARPDLADRLEAYLNEQRAVERSRAGIDEAACPTASMLADLLALLSEDTAVKRVLAHLGMLLGRYIYYADCLCDLEQDRKRGRFNPLADLSDEEALTRMRPVLYSILHEAGATMELLPLKRCKAILGNIIYVGLEDTLKKEIHL